MPLVDWTEYAKSFISFEEKTGNLTSRDKFSGNSTLFNIPAARGGVTKAMLYETDGAAIRPSAAYQIRRSNLAVAPKPGDSWTEGGVTYKVQVVDFDDAHWIIGVYNPEVDAQMTDRCDVLLATQTKTNKATRRITQAVLNSSVSCRLQLQSSEIITQHKRIGTLDIFDVYFDDNLPILPDVHVLSFTHPVHLTSVIGDITSVTNAQRIGDLMTVNVEVRP